MLDPSVTRFVERDVPREAIDRLCFGAPVNQGLLAGETEPQVAHEFLPGQTFGVVWWRRDRRGHQHRALAVVQALHPGGVGSVELPPPIHALPGIQPKVAVIVMIDQDGPAGQDGTVDRMLDLIESIRRSGCDPARLPPRCWREAAYHLMLRHELPPLEMQDLIGSEETTCEEG